MKHPRRGYTLIESMVVIALTSVTLTLATLTMHLLHRGERRLSAEHQRRREIERFTAQWRWDVHGSQTAELAQDPTAVAPQQLVLRLAEGREIQYRVMRNRLERIVLHNSEAQHRESYRIAGPKSFWTLDTNPIHSLVALHLDDSTEDSDQRLEQVFQAAVGVSAVPSP